MIRVGSIEDADAVLGLLDRAVQWLIAKGRTGQWGDQPWSASEKRVARIHEMVAGSELLVLERDGVVVGALAHGREAHGYVPAAAEPEDYVLLLVSDPGVRGAGRLLLEEAWLRARVAGVGLQRVDCYAGDDGKLVRFYESAGFTATERFEVAGWPGQLLERRA